jgi:hypothetical protein
VIGAWIAVLVLAALVLWLALALAGAVRALADVRARVEALEAPDLVHLPAGVPVGSAVPAWTLRTLDGSTVSSSDLAGRRHLLLFADADCSACDEVVPAAVRAAAAGELPPVAVVGRGDAAATPATWRSPASPRVLAGAEEGDRVSRALGVVTTPHAIVVDETGHLVAQGSASDLDQLRALVRAAEGIRVVGTAGDG